MTPAEKEAFAVLSQFLGSELAGDIITHRKGLKCPLTARGARSLVKEYQKTGHMVEAAEYHLNMGWRGFEASWFKRPAQSTQQAQRRPGNMGDFASEFLERYDAKSGVDRRDDQGPQYALADLAPSRRQ